MRRRTVLASLLAAGSPTYVPFFARAQTAADRELAPDGRLRVVCFLNPPTLRRRADGAHEGLTMDVGTFVAGRIGATVEIAALPGPAAFAAALAGESWDLGLGPRAIAAGSAHWGGDLMLLDNQVVVRPEVEVASLEALDRPGLRLAVVVGGPPESHFTAALKQATLVRAQTIPEAIATLAEGRADAYAANGENAARAMETVAGARLVPGSFLTIQYAAGIPLSRSATARARLAELLAEVRQANLVSRAIERDRLRGTRVAG
jgi:polar amino acid transport system substrate-binding protein